MSDKTIKEIVKETRNMEEDEVYQLFLENINTEIDRTILEIAEEKRLTVNRVMEDYSLQIKKALFMSRNQL